MAAVVEQPYANVLPDGVLAINSHRVGSLDFNDAVAASATDGENVPRYLRKSPVLDLYACSAVSARVPDDRIPIGFW